MAEYYSQLPQNAKQAIEMAQSNAKINEIRQLCQNAEVDTVHVKLNDAQAQCFHFQLLTYLILDELPLAKYLFKRVPKEIRGMQSFVDIWDIGCSMWKSDHSGTYKKIENIKCNPVFKPFIDRLSINYRSKQAALVCKSYTSITIKELCADYLGFKDIKVLTQYIKKNKLNDEWIYDNPQKPTIVKIKARKEDYGQLLDQKLS
eukprot:103376_1